MIPGQAAYTPAFDLNAKYIIHTVGPAWRGGGFGERETVAACYRNSLWLAKQLECESIAFPLLATGTYGFPKDEALRIAIAEISSFLLDNDMEVMLVVYDKESFRVSGKLFSDIRTLIDDNEVERTFASESKRRRNLFSENIEKAIPAPRHYKAERSLRKAEPEEISALYDVQVEYNKAYESIAPAAGSFQTEKESLDDRVIHLDKTFQQYLFMLIDRKGKTDPEVYKKANIDRKHFSKIRSNVDYQPTKRTALALAIALELSLDETTDQLRRAGLALSTSILFDKIIEHCIETKNYNIFDINCILFNYDQPMLGA